MKKILMLAVGSAILVAGCQKADFDTTVTGEGLNAFALNAPASNAIIALNGATPDAKVEISWTASKPGVDVVPTYKWVAAQRNGGNLETPLLEIASDNSGKDTKLTFTHKQLDDVLKGKGIADGAKAELIWSVKADNGSVQLLSADNRNLTITRMKDGATTFILLGPGSSGEVKAIDPNSTTQTMQFNWTKSKPAPGGTIKYKVLFAERKLDADEKVLPVDWTQPLFVMDADNNGSDSLASIVYKAISDSLDKKGFTNQELPVDLLWTVVATSGTWTQYADYVNQVMILREIKVFIVGSATPIGWAIDQSPRLIPDPRFPGTFFTYITLTGGGEFKFVNGQVWPPAPGAIDWGQDPNAPAGNVTGDGEQGIQVATTGIYRVTFDYSNKKYYVQSAGAGGIGGLGIVGGFQGWNAGANVRMSNLAPNKMIVFQDMTTGDGFKFHDGNDWNNSNNNGHRWFGLEKEGDTKLVVDDGGKKELKWTGASGRVRVIFDGTDVKNLTYYLSAATEMRVVGNGMADYPAWSPGASPQMTYEGNGQWKITLNLVGGMDIKFLAGNDWGAFDYEDAGNGKIKYDGGGNENFKVPAATRSYTIILDELKGTVSIQ